MKKIMFGLMAVVALATTSCNKETTEEQQPLTTENVAGAYTVTTVEAEVSGMRGPITDQWYSENMMGECAKDDITTFLSTGVYDVSDGNVVCDPSNETSGTWSVQNNVMMMDGETVNVESFTGKTLKLSMTYSSGSGSNDKLILTYTRK